MIKMRTVRGDYGMNVIMRLYAPDLDRFASWTPPRAESLGSPGER
jgi:hypothetical protein